jgi:heme-degrading monooxygenase HmoA
MLLRKRERRMFARISTIQGSPERLEAGKQYFEEHVIPVIETLDGFQGAYFLIDRKSGKTVRISLWETEEALQASAEAVVQVRSEGAEITRDWRDPFPGSPVVEVFEVAVRR